MVNVLYDLTYVCAIWYWKKLVYICFSFSSNFNQFISFSFSCVKITTDEDYSSSILQDLSSRRGKITNVVPNPKDSTKVIQASVPLSELRHYSNTLRKITHGQTNLSMEFSHYEEMSEEDKNKAIEEVTGFPVNPKVLDPVGREWLRETEDKAFLSDYCQKSVSVLSCDLQGCVWWWLQILWLNKF